ncbi:MAG: hypothetical protein KBA24_08095 [Dysgonomonadaceae bacterium]|nr:hypothetical protein [Dysgonamonadaceae bacterium]
MFFKWIEQNLTVKKLWGHSPNAVKIHLWTAICSYRIVAYIKHLIKSPLSIYEIIKFYESRLLIRLPYASC